MCYKKKHYSIIETSSEDQAIYFHTELSRASWTRFSFPPMQWTGCLSSTKPAQLTVSKFISLILNEESIIWSRIQRSEKFPPFHTSLSNISTESNCNWTKKKKKKVIFLFSGISTSLLRNQVTGGGKVHLTIL